MLVQVGERESGLALGTGWERTAMKKRGVCHKALQAIRLCRSETEKGAQAGAQASNAGAEGFA